MMQAQGIHETLRVFEVTKIFIDFSFCYDYTEREVNVFCVKIFLGSSELNKF